MCVCVRVRRRWRRKEEAEAEAEQRASERLIERGKGQSTAGWVKACAGWLGLRVDAPIVMRS